MASKELPTLGTGIPKTRKRNIQTKLDPNAFRTRLFEKLAEHELNSSIIPAVSSDEFDYSRYGEVFTEVMIAGNIVEPGGHVVQKPEPTLFCVFNAGKDHTVNEVIDIMHQLMRRKPFLKLRFDSVMTKLLSCLAVFEEEARVNLAVALACMLDRQMVSTSVLSNLASESAISSGIALHFMTGIITSYLETNGKSVEKLMTLLKSAGIDTGTMVEMMPSGSRSADALSEHFKKLGLFMLVEQNERRVKTDNIRALREGMITRVNDAIPVQDTMVFIQEMKTNAKLTDKEIVQAAWMAVTTSIDMSRKIQQNRTELMVSTQKWAPLLEQICLSGPMQLELIVQIQAFVTADMELLKISAFTELINLLYHKDVLSEEAILRWFRRGMRLEKGSAASSDIIREQMRPFIKWLETAEEESDEE